MSNANARPTRNTRIYQNALARWMIALRRFQAETVDLLSLPAAEYPEEVFGSDEYSLDWWGVQIEARGLR